MTKRHLKLAAIRKNDDNPCPYGLPIPFGCQYSGGVIDRMATFDMMGKEVTDEEKQEIADANVKLLAWSITNEEHEIKKCPYAAKIFEEKNSSECNYDDTAPGEGQKSTLMAAPFYSQIFSGIALNGLYSYPIGYYADYNISRNLFYGIFSLQGGIVLHDTVIKVGRK
jgi:hypothetical protein